MRQRYWCWWMCRYLLITGRDAVRNGQHVTEFEDFGDVRFWLTDEQVGKLVRK